MLARALQHDVPHLIRVKGADYFRRGAVRDITPSERGVTATVRGTFDYTVAIEHESGGGFIGSCECPYFADRGAVCKHIWAVLLTPDTEAALAASGPIPKRAWIDAAGPRSLPDLARHSFGQVPSSARAPETWQHFLSEVQRNVDTGEAGPEVRHRQSQIVYIVDVPASISRGGAELSVQTRTRKKDGEWAKPKPLSLARHEIDQLADDQDREILAMLRGADRAWSYLPGSPVYPQPHQ